MPRLGFFLAACSFGLAALSVLLPGCACDARVHLVPEASDAGGASVDDAGLGAEADASAEVDAGASLVDAAVEPEVEAHLVATFRTTCLLGEESRCWGVLIDGTDLGTVPQPASRFDGVSDLRIASSFHCVHRADRRVACAGGNYAGQLGVSPAAVASRDTLEPVPGVDSVTRLAIDGSHACVLRADGSVWCWGGNTLGAVGREPGAHAPGASVPEWVAMPVPGITGAIDVAVGGDHSCAALADGSVWCWGYDSYGQLGRGGGPATHVPQRVVGLGDAIAIDARGNSTCALLADGSVWCWGRHTEGQLGIADEDVESCSVVVSHPCARVPRRVVGVVGATTLAFGGTAGCAYGALEGRCWGTVDAALEGEDVIDELAVGWEHACVRQHDDRVRCIGRGREGQLGDGEAIDTTDWVEARLVE